MNKLKFLLVIFLFFFFVFFSFSLVLAADLNIDCSGSSATCSQSGLDPLFSSSLDGFWYPGKSITKTLNLKNSSSQTRKMAIKGKRTLALGILEKVMEISIVGGKTVIWSGSVADFYNQEKIEMGTFNSGANLNYNFTVLMSFGLGDEYQNQETVFDLTLGFWGEPILTPTPATTSGGSGGITLGSGVSAPVCNDTKPGSAPTLTSVLAGLNSVTLFWNKAADPVSYYLVTYGMTAGAQTYGNPNVGDQNTTSYTVSGLSGGTTYYFKVRSGNGCMPGDYSNELAVIPTGVFVAGPATGFIQGVLGEKTPGELGGASSTGGFVAGTQTEPLRWWWLILPGIGVVIIFFGSLLIKFFLKGGEK